MQSPFKIKRDLNNLIINLKTNQIKSPMAKKKMIGLINLNKTSPPKIKRQIKNDLFFVKRKFKL